MLHSSATQVLTGAEGLDSICPSCGRCTTGLAWAERLASGSAPSVKACRPACTELMTPPPLPMCSNRGSKLGGEGRADARALI